MKYLVLPAFLVTALIIDVFGAYASRRFKFEYGILTPLQLLNYFLVGYFAAIYVGPNAAAIFAMSICVMDFTLGWDLAKRVGFYTAKPEMIENRTKEQFIVLCVIMTIVAGALGLWGSYCA